MSNNYSEQLIPKRAFNASPNLGNTYQECLAILRKRPTAQVTEHYLTQRDILHFFIKSNPKQSVLLF